MDSLLRGGVETLAQRLFPPPLVRQASIVLSALTWLVGIACVFLAVVIVFFMTLIYREWTYEQQQQQQQQQQYQHPHVLLGPTGHDMGLGNGPVSFNQLQQPPMAQQSLAYFLAEKLLVAILASVIAQLVARMVIDAQVWDSVSLYLLNMTQSRPGVWIAWSDQARQYLVPAVVALLAALVLGMTGWLAVSGARATVLNVILISGGAVFALTLVVLLFTRWAARRVALVESRNAFLYLSDPLRKPVGPNPMTTLSIVICGDSKAGKTSLVKAMLGVNPNDSDNPLNDLLVASRDDAPPKMADPIPLPGHKDAMVFEASNKELLRNSSRRTWDVGVLVSRADQVPLDKDKEMYRMLSNRCRTVRVVLSHSKLVPADALASVLQEWQRVLGMEQRPFATNITGYTNHEREDPEPWVCDGVDDLTSDILSTMQRDGLLWRSEKSKRAYAEAAAMIIAQGISAMVWPTLLSDEKLIAMTSLQTETDLYKLHFPQKSPERLPECLLRIRAKSANDFSAAQQSSQLVSLWQRMFLPVLTLLMTRNLVFQLLSSTVSFMLPMRQLWGELIRLLQFAETCRDARYTDEQHLQKTNKVVNDMMSVRSFFTELWGPNSSGANGSTESDPFAASSAASLATSFGSSIDGGESASSPSKRPSSPVPPTSPQAPGKLRHASSSLGSVAAAATSTLPSPPTDKPAAAPTEADKSMNESSRLVRDFAFNFLMAELP